MKLKLAAVALFCSVAMVCSESNADLLGRMLGRGGCGGSQAVSSCCDTPAPVCGGRNFGISININIGLPGRLFRGTGCGGGGLLNGGGCGGGVVSNINDGGCGCGAVADMGCGADAGCGCGGGKVRDLFGRVRGRLSGLGSRLGNLGGGCGGCGATDGGCGCSMPAPAPSCGPTCGDAGCGCGGGLLQGGLFQGGLFSRLGSNLGGGCGCGAPAGDCGCGVAPAPAMSFSDDCGCNDGGSCLGGGQLRGRVTGLLSRLKPSGCGRCGAPAGDCGCAAPVMAAPVDTCGCGGGCDGGCGLLSRVKGIGQNFGSRFQGRCGSCGDMSCGGGCGAGKLSLLNRLRGDRTLRNSCNDGCQPACPNSGCGGGCDSCGGNAVQYDSGMNMQPIMQPAPQMAPRMVPTQAAPVIENAVPAATESGVLELPAATTPDGASYRQPVVDPSAFVTRNN